MRVLIPLFLLCVTSLNAEEEDCSIVTSHYDVHKENGTIKSITKKNPSDEGPHSIQLFCYGNITIESYAFNNSMIDELEIMLNLDVLVTGEFYRLSVTPESFVGMYLSTLAIAYANIDLNGTTFTGVESVKSFTLTGCNYTEVPTELLSSFPNLESLSIDLHMITRIPARAFAPIRKLKYLKLGGNPYMYPLIITTLDVGCFHGLEELVTLELTNSLQKIVSPIFDGLSKLRHLAICGNGMLQSIEGNIFQGLSQLTALQISSNGIRSLEPGTFDSMPHLKKINLNNNDLNVIPKGLFNRLSALKVIHLVDNNILTIKSGAFCGLNLTQLRVNSAFAKRARHQPGAFSNLTVWELELDSNEIQSLAPKSFDGLTANTVNLKYNRLSKIGPNDFFGLKAVNLLLSYNNMVEIERDTFKDSQVDHIDLEGNRIQSGGRTLWGLAKSVTITPESLTLED